MVKVIGIAGPSGSGKSTLCHTLVHWLSGNPFKQNVNDDDDGGASTVVAVAFPEDPRYFLHRSVPSSYKDRDPLSETPASMDWDAYVGDLKKRIQELEAQYYYKKKGSSSTTSVFLVVEHFLLLQDSRIRNLLDLLLYLDPTQTSNDARVILRERRVQRSPRTEEESNHLRGYYDNHVWPSFLQYTHAVVETIWSCDTEKDTSHHHHHHGPCPLVAVDCIGSSPEEIQRRVQEKLLQECNGMNAFTIQS